MPSGDKYFVATSGQYGYPIASFVSSKVYNSTGLDSTRYLGSEGKVFQQGGTNTANLNTCYKNQGTDVVGVLLGHLPTKTFISSITTAGSYTLKRTNTELTIGSTTYPASSFRDGVVPYEIVVCLTGGGGGGGGNAWFSPGKNKSGYNMAPGGGGAAGTSLVARILLNTDETLSIIIGDGGAAGSTGGSSSSGGDGTAGSGGGPTGITNSSGASRWRVAGGAGGGGASRSGDDGASAGAPGDGNANYDFYCNSSYTLSYYVVAGGHGNTYGHHDFAKGPDAIKFYITSGTGAPESSFGGSHSNTGSAYNKSTDEGTGSYLSGGCSLFGDGNWFSGGTWKQGGAGGGGSSGTTVHKGNAGGAYFYY